MKLGKALVALAGMGGASMSMAGILNGNFESTPHDLGWIFLNGAAVTNYNDLLPCEGEYFGYAITTNIPIGLAIQTATTFDGPSESVLKFCYRFFTDELSGPNEFNDRFEVRLVALNGYNRTIKVTDVYTERDNAGFMDTGAGIGPTNFQKTTPWRMAQYDVSDFVGLGPVNVYFTAVEAGDNNRETGFAIDDVQAVPEPASMATIGVGVAALISRRRRRSRA